MVVHQIGVEGFPGASEPGADLALAEPLSQPDESEQPEGKNYLAQLVQGTQYVGRGAMAAAGVIERTVSGAAQRGMAVIERGDGPVTEVIVVPGEEQDHTVIAMGPDPATGIKPSEAKKAFFLPGLGELDASGGTFRLARQHAKSHPDQEVIVKATPGMSQSGALLAFAEAGHKTPAQTAKEVREVMRYLAADNESEVNAVSMGTNTAMHVGAQELEAKESQRLNITGFRLYVAAAFGKNIPPDEDFREETHLAGMSDEQIEARLKTDFRTHVAKEVVRMGVRHPREVALCLADNVIGYALSPSTAVHRAKTVAGNYKQTATGIDHAALRGVTENFDVFALGGAEDPLAQVLQYQWEAHGVPHLELEGEGHLLPVKAPLALDEMEHLVRSSRPVPTLSKPPALRAV